MILAETLPSVAVRVQAQEFLYGGRFYFQYAAPGTEYNVYANGTYVGDNPLGPFAYAPYNPVSYKPGGFMTGAGHGNTFQDNYGNWWNTGTPSRAGTRWAGPALTDLLGFAKRRAARQIDPRVSRVVENLYARYGDLTPVAQLAGSAGLSASRFQHLFTQEVGVPFRRYRAWQRMRAAIREIVHGSNFTTAAHAAGFSDQAHFAHDFRRTFGAPASRSLSRVRASAVAKTSLDDQAMVRLDRP